jgi:hypothetical protein
VRKVTFVHTLNLRPYSDGEAWWEIKEKLVTGGWSVKLSSDGTTFGASDNLSPGGPYVFSGAGSFDNANGYMVWQSPSITIPGSAGTVVREVCVAQGTFDRKRVFVSSDGTGFTGGDATNRPTAADEQVLHDNNSNLTSQSPPPFNADTFPQLEQLHIHVGDATEGYSFLVETRVVGTALWRALFFIDHVESPVENDDDDPAIYAWSNADSEDPYRQGTTWWTKNTVGSVTSNIGGWFRKGEASEAWVAYPWGCWGYQDGFGFEEWHSDPSTTGGQAEPSDDLSYTMVPMLYGRGSPSFTSTALGYKGKSTLFRITILNTATDQGMVANSDRTLVSSQGIVRAWDGATEAL